MKILIMVYNWYINSIIYKNWLLIAFLALTLTLISKFIFNKPESQIMRLWRLLKHMDQKSSVFYQKKR